MARDSYNVDVEYDLNDSDTVSYKGATIKVISANNSMIKYKVISHFNNKDL